ncbi:cytochrome c-550 [Leptolyngbya valderiana BDU 20041]|uniref:photosystem II cytochrome c-550 n=1 Tax=Baaleninema simplex TaxID=2862350 RepID=UPI0004771A51|nr:photosystem II cytochrome c-550 [Baaleninema simplex]MDC0832216.1 photosystem II cytochrome c-550 [Geitlerinema sp. CS-897]OAB62427.1 cytochrome c-550 [Leptolyngbya valderiana BDU 20041]
MLKRVFGLAVATVFFAFQIFVNSAAALDLDAETRTVPLNAQGDTVTLSLEQATRGQRLFGDICAQCHPQGITKTNPNVKLGLDDLALATPRRDNVEALVDYMEHPTTYDGETDISELHPATSSADIFPEMRNLTEEDLFDIAGHILIQPKLRGVMWGGGKVYN